MPFDSNGDYTIFGSGGATQTGFGGVPGENNSNAGGSYGLPSIGAPSSSGNNSSLFGGSSTGGSTIGDIAKIASIGIPLLTQLFHLGTTPTQTASTPSDLLGMRKQQIGLLQYLLGFGPDPRTSATSTSTPLARAKPQGFAQGGVSYAHGGAVKGPGTGTSDSIPAKLSNGEGVLTANTVHHLGGPEIIALLNHMGEAKAAQMAAHGQPQTMPMGTQVGMQTRLPHMAAGGVIGIGGTTPYTGSPGVISASPGVDINPTQQGTMPGNGDTGTGTPAGTNSGANSAGGIQTPQQRLESFYGPLGVNASPLQNQGTNAYSQFLNQPSPWDQTMNVTGPQLQQNMAGNPSTQNSINGLMGLTTGAGSEVNQGLGGIASNPGGVGGFTGSSAMNSVLQGLGQGTTGAQQNLSQLGQGPSTGNNQLQQYLNSLAMGQGTGNLSGLGQVNSHAGINSVAGNALGQLASSNPGQAVVDSLQPLFQQNLAAADQVGGRFGTSNALGRQNATTQFNNTAANALQTGATQQQQAASSLGQLGSAADQTNMQGGIASANNQLQGGLAGSNNQLQALGLAQTGNLGQQQIGLGANSNIANQQLGATGQSIGAQSGLNANALTALSQLGGFNTQGNAQAGTNANNAGQLGLGQGNLSNNAAGIYGQLANNQGNGNLNTVNSAFNAGTTNTNQGYQGQQNTINLMQQLLGAGQSASIGGPAVSTPGAGTQVASTLAQLLPLLFGSSGNQGQPGYYVPQVGGSVPQQTGTTANGGVYQG